MRNYSVTKDIPAGISNGIDFGTDIEAASSYFGEAAYMTSAPTGTVVTFWMDDEVIDRATVTEASKAAYRAETSAALDKIIAAANERYGA